MTDYTRDEFGHRFPEKEGHVLDRMQALACDIHVKLIEQDNLIPNEPNLEAALKHIAEVEHLIGKLHSWYHQ